MSIMLSGLARSLAPVLAVAAAVSLAPMIAAPTATAAGPPPSLLWTACGDGFECANAAVPVDHADPDGRTITLPVIRRPAADPAARQGVLVLIAGGPGSSGVNLARNTHAELPPELRDRFDVVGFDPRGVAGAGPVRCWDDVTYAARVDAARAGRPAVPQLAARAAQRLGSEFAAACERNVADLLPHLGAVDVARDLDLLRRALGEEQISYLARSYGTYIGTVYASMFPTRVRAAVLDGGYDPARYTTDPYAHDRAQYVALDAAFGRFLAWCAAAADCAFGAGAPAAAFDLLVARLDAAPVTIGAGPTARPATGWTLLFRVLLALNSGRAGWPDLAANLAAAEQGGGPLLAPPSPTSFLFLTANTAVECTDRDFPGDRAELRARLLEHADAGGRFGPALAFGPPSYDHSHASTCVAWPAAPGRYLGPYDATGSGPIAVIGTTGDPDTPYQDSVALATTLTEGQLITFEAEGHTGFGRSACVTAAATAVLTELTAAPDPRCADEAVPGAPMATAWSATSSVG